MKISGCTPCSSLRIVKRGLTGFVFDFVVVLEFSAASVEANLLQLLAGEVNLRVNFSRRLVQGHKLVKRANLKLALVNS